MKHEWIFAALSMLICASCNAGEPAGRDSAPAGEAEVDVAACEAGGGTVQRAGLLGLPRCVTPYPDAGAVCSDSSDCAGRCLAADEITDYNAPSGQKRGLCEADDSPFGCFAEIIEGDTGPAICVD